MKQFNSKDEIFDLTRTGGHLVVVTRGASCSGKDTVAAGIGEHFDDVKIFSTDDRIGLTAEQYATNFSMDTLGAAHAENFRLFVERCQYVEQELDNNYSSYFLSAFTAVTNTCCSDWEMLGYITAANAYGAKVVIIHCDATLETILGRTNRAGAPDSIKRKQLRNLARNLERPTFPGFIIEGILTVDTNG